MDSAGVFLLLWLGLTVVLIVATAMLGLKRKHLSSALDAMAQELSGLKQRFAAVVDADAEAASIVKNAQAELVQLEARLISEERVFGERISGLDAAIHERERQIEALQNSYKEKRNVFDSLISQMAIYDERLSFAELGIYEPHFDFDTSELYKSAVQRVRDQQKGMVQDKTAVVCRKEWTLDGSAAKGRVMTDRNIRLTLRAFNNECEAAIANVRWNNVNAMERRILNARAQIDKQNQSNATEITTPYVDLKLKELYLAHEYRERLKEEREDRAEMARAAREEAKLQREVEAAEREEVKYQKMLEKARKDASAAIGAKQEVLHQQVQELERQLEEAHAKAERAQAMAERTRTGYVYIISNIGSFGPDFVKIGLTRRLDPTDRIRELGDASVPFLFDTHAIIYSEDAPALERALHNEFADVRVNAMNFRKEFFRVSLEQVEAAVERLAPGASFFKDIEAQEFQETLSMRRQHLENRALEEAEVFPAEI